MKLWFALATLAILPTFGDRGNFREFLYRHGPVTVLFDWEGGTRKIYSFRDDKDRLLRWYVDEATRKREFFFCAFEMWCMDGDWYRIEPGRWDYGVLKAEPGWVTIFVDEYPNYPRPSRGRLWMIHYRE